MTIHAPFSEEDKTRIDDALLGSKEAHDLLQRAERAGLDMGSIKQRLHDSENRLRGIRQQFFEG